MKKKLLAAISYVVILALGITGTVAYFTDREAETNVFTVGDVAIELNEVFDQGVELMPGKKIEKEVTVANTGKNDAWVWVTIAIPSALDNDDASQNAIHFNYAKDSVGDGKWTWMNGTAWNVEKDAEIKGDNNKYNIYTVMYQTALKPGAVTESAMTQVYMDTRVDMTPEGDLYIINNGVPKTLNWNVNADKQGTPLIYVAAYAIQKDTFETVQAAHDAYIGQWGGNNAKYPSPEDAVVDQWDGIVDKTWFDAEAAANATPENPVTFAVDTAEEFAGFVNLANTNSFKNVTIKLNKDIDLSGMNWNEGGAIAAYGPAFNGTLDGNGHSIVNLGASNNWTYANGLFRTVGNDVTIKNLTIEGADINNAAASGKNKEYGILVGIVGGGTLTIENVRIVNSSVSCKNAAGLLVGGMTEGAIKCKDVVFENCDVEVTSASGKGGAILGDGWSAHDYDYAGVYTDNVEMINCTYTVAGVQQAELPLYNYVK